MIAFTAACSPALVKHCAFQGMTAAFLHVSACCQEKWAPKFKSGFNGNSKEKDYLNYIKRKRRAEAKRYLWTWRSFEVHIHDFDQLYWSCGSKSSSKSRKQRNGGKNHHYKWSEDTEDNPRSRKHKRSGHANQEASQKEFKADPFQFIWQSEKNHFSQWWGFASDFFFEERSTHFSSGFSRNSDSSNKKKVKVEATVGLPSDRQTLGLPPTGCLTMEELKKAFRLSAMKWHPDRHEGASKATAEAKFKDCGAAYRSLLNALAKA